MTGSCFGFWSAASQDEVLQVCAHVCCSAVGYSHLICSTLVEFCTAGWLAACTGAGIAADIADSEEVITGRVTSSSTYSGIQLV